MAIPDSSYYKALAAKMEDSMFDTLFRGIDYGSKDSSVVTTGRMSDQGAFTIETMQEMVQEMVQIVSPPRLCDAAIMSERVRRHLQPGPIVVNPIREPGQQVFGGIKITTSPFLPIVFDCKFCDATGEGTESTYCEHCGGAGAISYDGIMTGADGQMILIKGIDPLPKKFEPSFPDGLVPMPPLCRGLP